MKRVLIIHGPNLNMLGIREKAIYGETPLYQLNRLLIKKARELNLSVTTFHSNSEADVIEAIHKARGNFDFIIINPGGLTHTSVALRDALLSSEVPFIEVHLSNIYSREDFRKKSMLSDIAKGVISGLGAYSYILALHYVSEESESR